MDQEKSELIERLKVVGFKAAPLDARAGLANDDYHCRAVFAYTPGGVYFRIVENGDVQLLVVGPMVMSPAEYADKIHRGYWVKETKFLGTDTITPEMRQLVINRGFISILLRHQDDEMPSSAVVT